MHMVDFSLDEYVKVEELENEIADKKKEWKDTEGWLAQLREDRERVSDRGKEVMDADLKSLEKRVDVLKESVRVLVEVMERVEQGEKVLDSTKNYLITGALRDRGYRL